MRVATFSMIILFSTFAVWTTQTAEATEVYRWVDENGVVHFVDQAPEKQDAEIISIPESPDINTETSAEPAPDSTGETADPQPTLAQQIRDERAAKRRETEESAKKKAKNCTAARNAVSQLEPSPRVNVTHEDGTVTRMDDNDRLERLSEAKAFVAEHCAE